MKQYKLSHIARAAMLLAVFAMLAACEVINAALDTDVTSGGNYLYDDNGTVKQRNLSFTTGEGTHIFGATARVRPVVTVTIAKE